MKNKNFLARMLNRNAAEAEVCPDICWEGQLYKQVWRDGRPTRVGEPLGPCPENMEMLPPREEIWPLDESAGSMPGGDDFLFADSAPPAAAAARNEPPLICWEGQLYRQKLVDGGLEAYGEPLGPCEE